MWYKWLPWRWIVQRAAQSQGFLDPIKVLSQLRKFSQPSEVMEPLELLRAGVVFHARGLMNTSVIQHNLDWIWPFWVERQFNPLDPSFIPRAFSITHVNLTHRNWTALGIPECEDLPIVDPRGLLTPTLDGWSIDSWIIAEDTSLIPSRIETCGREFTQHLAFEDGYALESSATANGLKMITQTAVKEISGKAACIYNVRASSDHHAHLVISIRPYNPEGVSFIHDLSVAKQGLEWTVNEKDRLLFDMPPDSYQLAHYSEGDVYTKLSTKENRTLQHCDVGMASGAAIYNLMPSKSREVSLRVPLESPSSRSRPQCYPTWPTTLESSAQLILADPHFQFLYDAAVRNLILHSPHDGNIYPGPYTYKRFWFRDAAFIIHALLCLGLTSRAERAINHFPTRQTSSGYFKSQEGEWDSNGEVLWIMQRFTELTGGAPKPQWINALKKGADWILHKRLSNTPPSPHAGLLPAGFSAEHLGPIDYYFWDNYWSLAGLQSAAKLLSKVGKLESAKQYELAAEDYSRAIERSLENLRHIPCQPAIPASPYRRMDAGAIGSLVCGYPLMLLAATDPRLIGTADWLIENCLVLGGFFQDMIHSGINPYLTLHIAQVLLRANDTRSIDLMNAVAALASPTGQWPEAIHPSTHGGCMGDGQHAWASAEWVLMLRNCFVREEGHKLVIASGIPSEWIQEEHSIFFGPAPTSFGEISITINTNAEKIEVSWEAAWHRDCPTLEIALPQYSPKTCGPGVNTVSIKREELQ